MERQGAILVAVGHRCTTNIHDDLVRVVDRIMEIHRSKIGCDRAVEAKGMCVFVIATILQDDVNAIDTIL
jgi:hypothetical protein